MGMAGCVVRVQSSRKEFKADRSAVFVNLDRLWPASASASRARSWRLRFVVCYMITVGGLRQGGRVGLAGE